MCIRDRPKVRSPPATLSSWQKTPPQSPDPRPTLWSALGRRLHQSRTAGLVSATRLQVAVLGDHDLAPEDADQRAVLLVALGLDMDHATVILGRGLPLVQDGGLAIDCVPVEG